MGEGESSACNSIKTTNINNVMIRGFIVLLIGFFLTLAGMVVASNAPLGARDDVRRFNERPGWGTDSKTLSLQNRDEFYKAHLTKWFLTSAVVSLTGVGFMVVGVARLTSPEAQLKSLE